jgi:hypothetical protein
MSARDKLLALRAQNKHGSRTVKTAKSPEDPLLTVLTVADPSTFLKERGGPGNTAPSRSEPHFPERHCSECGKVSLWKERNRAEDADKTARSPAVTCWHCGNATYRPRRLAWGKDLILLHDRCIGPWIDAWDAMLTARSSPEEVRPDCNAPDTDYPEGSEEGDTDVRTAERSLQGGAGHFLCSFCR